MKKFTRALSFFLALIIAMAMAIPAFAVPRSGEIICNANIIFTPEIAGKTINDYKEIFPFEAMTTDYKDTDKLTMTEPSIFDIENSCWIENDEKLVSGRKYRFYLYFDASEGYFISDNFWGSVNGGPVSYNVTSSVDEEGHNNANVIFESIITTPGKSIGKINVSLNKSNMAGKSASDFRDYFSFSAEHILYGTDPSDVSIYNVTEEKFLGSSEKMVYGNAYDMAICLHAEDGYIIARDAEVKDGKKERESGVGDSQDYIHISFQFLLKDSAKCINRIDISFNSDSITGKCADDYLNLYTFIAEHTSYNTGSGTSPALRIWDEVENKWLDRTEKTTSGKIYEFTFYLKADEGYYFGDDVRVYINGKETDSHYYEGYGYEIYIDKNVTTFSDDKLIKRVDINLNDDITGKTPEDYKKYFTFSAAHCSYDDGEYLALYAYDYDAFGYIDDDAAFTEWKKYGLELYLVADKGYCFSNDLEVYVNGKKDDSILYSTEFCESSGSKENQDHLVIKLDKAIGSYTIKDMAAGGSAKYNQNVTATVKLDNLPSGSTVKIDGTEAEVRDGVASKNFGRLTSDKSFTVSVVKDGRELSSKTFTISVAHGFFDKIVGFFTKLFQGDKYATTINFR